MVVFFLSRSKELFSEKATTNRRYACVFVQLWSIAVSRSVPVYFHTIYIQMSMNNHFIVKPPWEDIWNKIYGLCQISCIMAWSTNPILVRMVRPSNFSWGAATRWGRESACQKFNFLWKKTGAEMPIIWEWMETSYIYVLVLKLREGY